MERTGGIRGRILSNLGRMMQIGGPTTEDHPKGDLAVQTRSQLCFISLSIFCYLIRFKVLGYLCHILLGLGFWAINICL